jgi:hypothetical protein
MMDSKAILPCCSSECYPPFSPKLVAVWSVIEKLSVGNWCSKHRTALFSLYGGAYTSQW